MRTVSDIGERGLIKLAYEIYKEHDESVDLTDDCSVIPLGNEYILASSDMISEKTHIPGGMTPWQIGWFVTSVNLSDIAAKGGSPLGVLLSFGLPRSYPELSFLDVIKGASSCATKFDTSIIGGDTKEHEYLVISGTALGKVKQDCFMSRRGAQPGDVVVVTGHLGKAAIGFHLLKEGIKTSSVNALCEPIPRVFEGMILAETKKVHCCMDISDGLSSSLYQLSELNNVGFEIERESLPLSSELQHFSKKDSSLDMFHLGLHYGGDYELLFTTDKESIPLLRESLDQFKTPLRVIGNVTVEKDIVLRTGLERQEPLLNQGYEHFSN